MRRRITTRTTSLFALCLILACEDADLFQPKPLESMFAGIPTCYGQTATIYPGNPGGGTMPFNALGGRTISGTPGADVISGTVGADSIFGLDGDDIVCGRGGDDVLIGGVGADRLIGNDGVDVASYSGSPAGVRIGLRGRGKDGDADGDILTLIEGIIGSEFRDLLAGDASPNVLIGLGGIDRIDGQGGADILDGGPGADEITFNWAPAAVTVDLTTNTGRRGWADGDTYLSFERITGSAYVDTLIGSGGPDRINGNAGSDVLYGMDGNDVLYGNLGNDKLYGGLGNDVLNGQTGTNTLDGGDGADRALKNCGDLMSGVEEFIIEECPASFRTSLISTDSVLVRADNSGSTIVTVQLKDEDDNALTEGGFNVELFTDVGTLTDGTSSGTSLLAVDKQDGTYELTLIGGGSADTATIRGIVNGDTLLDNALVTVSAGRTITWTGDANTAWENKDNWSPAVSPNPADSAIIPLGRPNYPVLNMNAGIIDIALDEGTTINIGAFDMNITGDAKSSVFSGGFVGIGRVLLNNPSSVSSKILRGRFPALRVFGRYAMDSNVTVIGGRIVVQGGHVRAHGFRIRVTPN